MPENDERPNEYECSEPWLGSFLNLDKPRTISKSLTEKPKFSVNFEIAKDRPDVARVRAAIVACAHEEWPQLDVGAAIKDGRLQVPLSDGDKLADKAAKKSADTGKKRLREWSRGKVVLVARSKDEFPPAVTFRENGHTVECETLDAVARAKGKYLYTGVQVLFGVKFAAYDPVGEDGKPSVAAYLEAVESLGTGERLIAQRDKTERFKGYMGIESSEDPTGADAGGDW